MRFENPVGLTEPINKLKKHLPNEPSLAWNSQDAEGIAKDLIEALQGSHEDKHKPSVVVWLDDFADRVTAKIHEIDTETEGRFNELKARTTSSSEFQPGAASMGAAPLCMFWPVRSGERRSFRAWTMS